MIDYSTHLIVKPDAEFKLNSVNTRSHGDHKSLDEARKEIQFDSEASAR